MKPSMSTLGNILYSQDQYLIPVYQRNYRWEEPEWEKLWISLTEIQKATKHGNHFMGFLVFVPGLAQPGENVRFYLVDGQQRLATLSILLMAIRNTAKQAGEAKLAKKIHDFYLTHPYQTGDRHFRLLPKQRDYHNYVSLIKETGNPTGRMADALQYFENKLNAGSGDLAERLQQTLDAACQRLEFMCATLETENAYNIFKSLNSTGVPLGSSDKIRNFVFMHIQPNAQDDFDTYQWRPLEDGFALQDGTLDEEDFSRFFRDYLMSQPERGYVQPSATFDTFELQYEATGFSPEQLATDLNTNAHYYEVISGDCKDTASSVTDALAGLNQLDSSTTYPLLLQLFRRRVDGEITADQFTTTIEMLRGFIFRRFVCGESSRGYGRMFVRAIAKLKSNPVHDLGAYLQERGWPNDARFEPAFVEFPLYQRGYGRQVLETLERERRHKEPADLTNTAIEHIMPQTLNDDWRNDLGIEYERVHATWLHRPGNLTLSAYGPELYNHAFAKKRTYYADSNVGLTRELFDHYPQWTEDEIKTRGAELAKEAARIWKGPKELVAPAEADSGRDDPIPAGRKLSDTKKLKQEFWAEFMQRLRAQSKLIRPRTPLPQYWMDFAIGRSDFGLQALMSVRYHFVGVSLMLVGPNKAAFYQQLHAQQSEIEAELGEALTWYELPDKKSSYVSLYQKNSDPNDRAQWPEQHQWIIDKLDAFHCCFSNRVKSLTTGDESPTEPSP